VPASAQRVDGRTAVIVGSASEATLGQLDRVAARRCIVRVDADDAVERPELAWRRVLVGVDQGAAAPIVVATNMSPAKLHDLRAVHGRARTISAVDDALARAASALVHEHGVRRLVLVGDETARAVLDVLAVRVLDVGACLTPGVHEMTSIGPPPLWTVCLPDGGGPLVLADVIDRSCATVRP
jgi:uncharacterized protein YgbK (DUF1537 family)